MCHWRLLLYLLLCWSYKKALWEREIVYMTLRTYYDVHSVVSFHRSLNMERYKNVILDLFGIVYNGNIF